MRILAIETSCDDTAIALLEVSEGASKAPSFDLLANEVSSQIELHREYGGVVPSLAKRAHAENIIPVLFKALGVIPLGDSRREAGGGRSPALNKKIEDFLSRYPEMLEEFNKKVAPLQKPDIDLIAVTKGPGLEPALWVGINFARALSVLWDKPILGVDHMEGHIAANLLTQVRGMTNKPIEFPAIALAVSGGHTQLILIKKWLDYELLGETLDDAAGEAFDKIARMLDLPYPGGPEIQKLAENGKPDAFDFPRPMLHSKNYDFSFSGLKTAVLYKVKELSTDQTSRQKANIAASFQQAVVDVLIKKTVSAAKEHGAKTVMLAGGVSANKALRQQMQKALPKHINFLVPPLNLSIDNAAMIAAAGYLRYKNGEVSDVNKLEADSTRLITD